MDHRQRDPLGEELGARRRREDHADGAVSCANPALPGEPGDDLIQTLADEDVADDKSRPEVVLVRFVVEEDFHGFRLDHYLKSKIRRLSRTRIQDIIRTQLEGPGGRRMKPHSPVLAGDALLIRRPARPEPPCPRTFGILLDDPTFLVIDKPAGLPVHASARYYFNTLTRVLRERFPDQPLQIAHRLDRETSGCLVVARGKTAATALKGAFERRVVTKTYLALVLGDPAWPEGEDHVIDVPLALADPTVSRLRIRMVPATGRPDALPAVTRVTVVQRAVGIALVSCHPVTGRQHQIRAHLAAAGHPIVGDKLYAHGDEAFARYCDRQLDVTEEEVRAEFGMARQALHASSIRFPHPSTGEPVTVSSPLPDDMRTFLAARGYLGST